MSNENAVIAEVFFDDLKIHHVKSPVIQYNEYHPYGLSTSGSWTRDNSTNNYLYNEGSESNGTTGWYETVFRDYDPVLGRFMQIDPLAAKYDSWSPYHFAFNDPVYWNDPSGAGGDEIRTQADFNRIVNSLMASENGGTFDNRDGTVRMFGSSMDALATALEGFGVEGNTREMARAILGTSQRFGRISSVQMWNPWIQEFVPYRQSLASLVIQKGYELDLVQNVPGFLAIQKFLKLDFPYDGESKRVGVFAHIEYFLSEEQKALYQNFNWIVTIRINDEAAVNVTSRKSPFNTGPYFYLDSEYDMWSQYLHNSFAYSHLYPLKTADESVEYNVQLTFGGFVDSKWFPIETVKYGFKYSNGVLQSFYPIWDDN